MPGELAAVIVFTFWGTAEMGDLVRSALISKPKHQYESGYGLGLTKLKVFIYIIYTDYKKAASIGNQSAYTYD